MDKIFKQRFWSKVKKCRNGCWIWTACIGSDGYGRVQCAEHRCERAHRIAYQIRYGEIPKGIVIMHSCDNSLCVNPQHLKVGSPLENSQDMVLKGRSAKGEKCARTKFSDKTVAEIRRFYADGNISYLALGEKFKMSKANIGKIINNRIRKI